MRRIIATTTVRRFLLNGSRIEAVAIEPLGPRSIAHDAQGTAERQVVDVSPTSDSWFLHAVGQSGLLLSTHCDVSLKD